MSSNEPNQLNSGDDEFEQALREVEQSLVALKQRYAQVQRDTQHQTELQQREQQLHQESLKNRSPELDKELQQIKEQLQELEVALESALLSDRHLKALFWEGLRGGIVGEVFWQIVRFGGIGVIIGWLLKSCAG
jgi:protein subunit release factor A